MAIKSHLFCEKPGCGADAAVGWGPKPVWLCIDHLREALAEAKKHFDRVIEERKVSQ